MFNLVYRLAGNDMYQTWELSDGFLKASNNLGLVSIANLSNVDLVDSIVGRPVVVPMNHIDPIFHVPENLRDKIKWVRIEAESIRKPSGITDPNMERYAKEYDIIYTYDPIDANDYFGRKINFVFGLVDTEMFKPTSEPIHKHILTFGTMSDERKRLNDELGSIVEYRRSEQSNTFESSISNLNSLINEYRYVMCPYSPNANHINGKILYALACGRIVFIQENDNLQYMKEFIEPNVHALYFKQPVEIKDYMIKYDGIEGDDLMLNARVRSLDFDLKKFIVKMDSEIND